jgi:hypothetical protein
MAIYKSVFPEPPPLNPLFDSRAFNVVHLFTKAHPHPDKKDYTLYIESDTRRQIGYDAYWKRVNEARTGLAGLMKLVGANDNSSEGEMVGILGENCIVRLATVRSCKCTCC